mgnify:FL=1
MGKLYIQKRALTPLDELRRTLDQAERAASDLQGDTAEPIPLLRLCDAIDEDLSDLEKRDVDLRVERLRFERLQHQLRHLDRRIVSEAVGAISEERATSNPPRSRWWWYMDQTVARERRRTWIRRLAGIAALALVLAGGWFGYARFLAPAPEVQQAYRHMESGMLAVQEGSIHAALTHFERASELTPDRPEPWLWTGALRAGLGETDKAERLFQQAEALYSARFDFVLNRGLVFLEAGQTERAQVDVESVIELAPDSGWGYYLRAGIAVRNGDYEAAVDDLQLAVDLAAENGNARLQQMAAAQRAGIAQMRTAARPK